MAKTFLQIGATDFTGYVKNYSIEYNVLYKEEGRNARGDMTLSVLNTKAKINATFRPTNDTEVAAILAALSDFVLSITYWDTQTNAQKTSTFYCSTPVADYYTNYNETGIINPISVSFVEL